MLKSKRLFSALAALAFVAASVAFSAAPAYAEGGAEQRSRKARRVSAPLNLAILVQDDLVSRVGNEIEVTRDFISALPAGSRVMVGYLKNGSLQVRQKFTEDLEQAGRVLRAPVGVDTAAPYNPYVQLVEALRHFDANDKNRNAVLLISDGLDVSRGFDVTSLNSVDLQRAVREAKRRNVAVYSFYAPSVGLTSFNRQAVSYGQGALNRLSRETGGEAFYQGTSFVSFNPYFERLSRSLNEATKTAY